MSTPVRASDPNLRALAGIVSEDRPDLPDGGGCRRPCWLTRWARCAATPCRSRDSTRLPGRRAVPPPGPPAHPRQNELVLLLAAGRSSQIARQLGISEGTARTWALPWAPAPAHTGPQACRGCRTVRSPASRIPV